MQLSPTARRVAITAGILAGGAGLLFGARSVPEPAAIQLTSDDDGPGDISGPCDEAEHADDRRCAGVAAGGTSTSSSTSSTSTTVASGTPAPAGATIRTLDASGAGTVRYVHSGGSLALVDAVPASGWAVEVEQGTGREIEVDFRSGTQRVQVNVELEDGQVRERVRVRDDADDTDTRIENGQVVRDDDDDDVDGDDTIDDRSDDDRSDDRDDDEDDDVDDSSGHGDGDEDEDEDEDDDDRSGSNSGEG